MPGLNQAFLTVENSEDRHSHCVYILYRLEAGKKKNLPLRPEKKNEIQGGKSRDTGPFLTVVAPMAKTMKLVSEVMVMAIPAFRIVRPISSTIGSSLVSAANRIRFDSSFNSCIFSVVQ